jgi:hypothetical protein
MSEVDLTDVVSVHYERAARKDYDGAVVLIKRRGDREVIRADTEEGPKLVVELRERLKAERHDDDEPTLDV